MDCTFYFLSHPNVLVQPGVPVPDWPLSELGHARMRACLRQPWIAQIQAVFSSTERKALDSATHLAEHLALPIRRMTELGETIAHRLAIFPLRSLS